MLFVGFFKDIVQVFPTLLEIGLSALDSPVDLDFSEEQNNCVINGCICLFQASLMKNGTQWLQLFRFFNPKPR
ncbi:MAG: hypothetical protein J0651_03615, partial [Actinobacteria bacterium]|nr:hypothetical protein [Actinomycetota bacterium]